MGAACRAGILIAAAMLFADPAWGQVVLGRVLDAEEGRPVPDAVVTLWSVEGPRDSTLAGTDGRFRFLAPPGEYRVTARHVAYARYEGRWFRIGNQGEHEVEVRLTPEVRALDAAEVTAERRLPHMERGGYYERRAQAAGRFIDRATIDRVRPRVVTDLMRRIPGVVVVDGDIRFSMHRNRTCVPTLVIDDVPLRIRGEGGGILMDYVVMPDFIEAIEVHARTGGLPSRYGGRNSPCGAVLIWTRRALVR